MSEKVKKITGRAAREFLRNRLGWARKPGKSGDAGKAETVAERVLQPDPIAGGVFMDSLGAVMDRDEKFGFLMVKTDVPHEVDDADANSADGIAEVVGSVCSDAGGLGGEIENGLFGCYLPDLNDRDALKVSRKIRKRINRRQNGTVSIGVAVYPMPGYDKIQIPENARKALNHAAFFGSDSIVAFDAVSLNISGDVLYQAGDINGAVNEFKMGLNLNPEEENLHNSLGVCYGEMGDLDAALESFEKAVGISPDSAMALHNTGYVKSIMGDTEGALKCFLKADRLDGSLFEVAFHTGKLYAETGRPEKGRAFLKKAVELNPGFGAAHFYLGECLRELNQRDRAMAAYKQAVKKNPRDAGALSALGLLYDEKGENPEISLMFCENSVEISPDTTLYLVRLGNLYEKHGDVKKALGVFERAASLGYDAAEKIEALKATSAQQDVDLENGDDAFPASRVATES